MSAVLPGASAPSGTVRLMPDSVPRESRAPAEVTELHRVKADSAASWRAGGAGAAAGLRSNVPADLGLMLPTTCHVSLCTLLSTLSRAQL